MNFVDLHCDTIGTVMDGRQHLRDGKGHLNLNRMRKAGYSLQTFAMFVSLKKTEKPCQRALDMIDVYYEELRQNQDLIRPVYCWNDIEENQKKGLMSALLSLEEGEICEGSLANLRNFYRLGVRMMTFTWNYDNSLAAPNDVMRPDFGRPQLERGLTPKGLEFLSEMERLGIIADVSHLGDRGFYDVYTHAKKPFIASHSNARSVCGHVRNLTDDMLRKIGERGGVAGLNFCADFVDPRGEEGGNAFSSVEYLVAHARHMTDAGGIEAVALGTDYDGIGNSLELKDCSMMPVLAEGLKKGGFTESQVDKILWGNAMRVFRELLI